MAAFLIDEQNRILSQDSLSRSRRSAELFYRRQPHDGDEKNRRQGLANREMATSVPGVESIQCSHKTADGGTL